MKDQDFIEENMITGFRRGIEALEKSASFQAYMLNPHFAEAFKERLEKHAVSMKWLSTKMENGMAARRAALPKARQELAFQKQHNAMADVWGNANASRPEATRKLQGEFLGKTNTSFRNLDPKQRRTFRDVVRAGSETIARNPNP